MSHPPRQSLVRVPSPGPSPAARPVLAVALGLLFFACDGTPAPGTGDAGELGGPAIAVVTRVLTDDAAIHYLHVLPELPDDRRLDVSRALELGDADARVFNGWVFVAQRDAPVLTRYEIGRDLRATEGPRLSFAATGVVLAGTNTMAFASPTRAFLLDSESGLIVTFDPSAMEIVATTSIPEDRLARDGYGRGVFQNVVVIGELAYSTAYWYDWENYRAYPRAALGRFSITRDDPIFEVIEDDRCGVSSAFTPFADSAGNVYAIGDWMSGFDVLSTSTPRASTAQCVLRVSPGASAFDPDFHFDLGGVTDYTAGYAFHPMDQGRSLLINSFSSTIDPASLRDDVSADWYWTASAFDWTRVDLTTGESERVETLPLGGAQDTITLTLDGLNYPQVYDEARGATLYEVSPSGDVRAVVEAGPGTDFQMLGRIR